MSTFGAMHATPIDILTPGKKRIALQRQSSESEKLRESLQQRRKESSVRKAAIQASLGKWENFDFDTINENRPSIASKEGEEKKKLSRRRKSVDAAVVASEKREKKPSSIRSKSQDGSSRTISTSPATGRRRRVSERLSNSSNAKEESDGSLQRTTKRRSSKTKRQSSRRLEMMLGSDEGNKPKAAGGGGSASVSSAPSQLQPNQNRATTRGARRGSRSPKSANNLATARRPTRRVKSSDLTSIAEPTRKMKRRSKSADADEIFAQELEGEMKTSNKSIKKGRTKKRPSKKKSGSSEASATENSTELESEQERSLRRERRRSKPGEQNNPTKRAHSAGPLKRNLEVGDRPERGLPARAASMMLNRDNTRRGKSESLADLVQYSQEEIHSTSYFASNHVLVNRERMKRGLRPLTRNIAMDTLARASAQAMATSAGCAPLKTTYVGNVLRGESIRAVHRAIMLNREGRERTNLLNPYFQDFGVGTSKGEDGMLYVCQLFSERLELSCTDAAVEEDKE